MENRPMFMTIKEVSRTGLMREYTLRQMVKQGKVPCIYSGKRCLINYPRLLEMLNSMKGGNA